MQTVTISGYSDDIIDVEGTVSGCDEYNTDVYGLPGYVELSTGDVFSVQFSDATGKWRVEHHVSTGVLRVDIERVELPATDDEDDVDDGDFTDVATVKGPITRVNFWNSWPPTMSEVRDAVEQKIEDMSAVECKKVFEALFGHRPWLQSI